MDNNISSKSSDGTLHCPSAEASYKKTATKVRRLFHRACADFSLLEDGDRVLVALSGGKDSLELVRLLGQQQRILKPRIQVEAAHVIMTNIPYETDRSYIKAFCEAEGVTLHLLESSFDESTDRRKTRCFLCSWNRRKALFQYATEHGFNKIALGHHNDDFIVTALMNATFEGNFSSMKPLMKMEHYPISIIRPLCLIPEELIKNIAEHDGFQRQKTLCPYEENTRRSSITDIFRQLEDMNPEARYSLWHALQKQ